MLHGQQLHGRLLLARVSIRTHNQITLPTV